MIIKETPDEEGKERPILDEKELKHLKELGLHQGERGKWLIPDGWKYLNKALARKMLTELHELTHWGVQGLCDDFLREHICYGIYDLAKEVTKGCRVCQKVNKKVMRRAMPEGRELALRAFKNIQVDFTEMPPVQGYKHLLVIVDHLIHWVEAFPTKTETTQTVARIILEEIIPRYGLVNTTQIQTEDLTL